MGLPHILKAVHRARALVNVTDNPDPEMLVGATDPNIELRPYARFKVSELSTLLALNGPIDTQLGRQWAVFIYSHWEHAVRPWLARREGCDLDDVKVSLFGDLRLIRNDILHAGSKAKEGVAARCELLKWFAPGDPVVITGTRIAEFMELVPWVELRERADRAAR